MKEKISVKIADFILLTLGSGGLFSFVAREYFNISYKNFALLFVLIILLLLLFWIIKNVNFLRISIGELKSEKLRLFIPIFLTMLVIRGFFIPVNGWDAYSLYDIRGKIFNEGLKQKEFAEFSRYDQTNPLYYYSYPPMTSSLHAIVYSMGMNTPMFLYALFYSALVFYIIDMLNGLKVNRYFKIVFGIATLANVLILQQITSAYTNLPMMAFQWGSFYHLLRYKSGRSKYDVIVASVLLAFSIWTRVLEPTFVAFFAVGSIFIFNIEKKLLNKLVLTSVFFIITISTRLIWSYYVASTVGSIGETSPNIITIALKLLDSLYLARIIEVIFFIYSALFKIKYYLILFIFVLLYKIVHKKYQFLNSNSTITASIVFMFLFIMTAGTLYLSVSFSWWDQIPGSFLRSNLIIMPLISMSAAYLLDEYEREKNKK